VPVGVAVEREVVHPQHPGRDQRRQGHPHQLGEHSAPGERDVQDAQHPGATPARQHHTHGLDQVLQQRGPPLVAHGQPRHLLGEGHLRAGRVLAVQPAHGQVDADRPTAERHIGEVPHIAAVAPPARLTASRARRGNTGRCAGTDRHDSIGNLNRDNRYIGQLR
jgi:hypothetical protein